MKKRLAHVLLQSIIRSRRQMLKAKCTHGFLYNSVSPSAAAALVVASPKPTSVFSVFKSAPAGPAKPIAAAEASNAAVEPVVHHPLVRKKARTAVATPLQSLVAQPVALAPQQQQQVSIKSEPTSAVKSALKRKRGAESTATTEVDETPLKAKRQQLASSMEASSFVSPAPTTGLSQQHQMKREHQSHITSQTPPQSSRKKIYIKMRIVPMDKAAKAHVVSSGCNPKVELKLTSTKRISEVAHHMAKKWEKACVFVPADAVLQFYESQVVAENDDNSVDVSGEAAVGGSGWSAKDRSVTCFDIWKRCGKKVKNENVVVVYYAWKVLDPAVAARRRKLTGSSDRSEVEDDIDVLSDDVARSPGSLFAEEISLADLGASSLAGSLAAASSSSHSTSSLARGLQQFGESMAFHSSEFSDAALWKDEQEAVSKTKLSKKAACPLDALLDENDEDEDVEGDGGADAFVDCSPDTQRLRRRITPMLVAKEEFDL